MNKNLKKILTQKYKHGFWSNIEQKKFPKGINITAIKLLSNIKKEPKIFKNFRIRALKYWLRMRIPQWSSLILPKIDYNNLIIYSEPVNQNSNITTVFEKCGISLDEENKGIAIDAVLDSISIKTTFKNKLGKFGIIFCSISEAIKKYPNLINNYLGSVVSYNDNYFSALNSAVFSDGSFCYIPKNIDCPLELSTYFRINNQNFGQFERTLIIAESNSSLSYLEGCTATQHDKNQLHAAIVEIIANNNAKIKYATVQNWYTGNEFGIGGIFNFVTKRGICLGKYASIKWVQVETGSAITWKYPSTLLVGLGSKSEFYSIALTNNFQQADTGTKMLHLGKYSKSKIISKGISAGFSKNTYRGLTQFTENAVYSKNFSQCDSFLIGTNSQSITFPYIEMKNSSSLIEHEAKISQITDEKLFYLQQRGINNELALSLIISGFCKDVLLVLPMEFATEANQLLQIKIENSIG